MSRLIIGDPRRKVRPPRGNPPCIEPMVYGTNILSDSSFETQLAEVGGAAFNNALPYYYGAASRNLNLFLWPNGPNTDVENWPVAPTPSPVRWCQDDYNSAFNPYCHEDSFWEISTADPRTGTYHARHYSNATQSEQPVLMPVLTMGCGPYPFPWAFRAMPGDYYRVGLWAKTSATGTVSDFTSLWVEFYDDNTDYLADGAHLDPLALTTSYVYYEVDGFVPASTGPVFAHVWYRPGKSSDAGDVGEYVDVDDAVLEVS